MCWCTPSIRTPCCGKLDCHPPSTAMPTPRRMANLYVSPEFLGVMMLGKYEVTANPLPRDHRVIGANYDIGRHTFVLTIESPELAEVPYGGSVPELPPVEITRL